ncbi:MAG: hypothetical protein ACK493_13105 [Planctomycetota bacterium]
MESAEAVGQSRWRGGDSGDWRGGDSEIELGVFLHRPAKSARVGLGGTLFN